MKNQEKFECGDCGCFYWVDDRDIFECPNCEQMEFIDYQNNRKEMLNNEKN